MRFQESRVLADDVHDVGSNNRFVVFTSFQFDKSKKLFDDRYKETFLCLLIFSQSESMSEIEGMLRCTHSSLLRLSQWPNKVCSGYSMTILIRPLVSEASQLE